MIIECINCSKKFEVNSDLIPEEGRTIQCGACNHVWFYDLKSQLNINPSDEKIEIKNESLIQKETKYKNENNTTKQKIDKLDIKEKALIKYQEKNQFKLSKFLSYILVLIITFIGLIIILDTFKNPLSIFFPNLELLLFNLFETLNDMFLFIKDLK
ncbi:zinc-ribbon domain-containing protein [Pelagibacterales bacterium SAG-MED01]|nr:zinc-ribbon domain-containing protein [Pelagibacterales bacterium SAG-MED01]